MFESCLSHLNVRAVSGKNHVSHISTDEARDQEREEEDFLVFFNIKFQQFFAVVGLIKLEIVENDWLFSSYQYVRVRSIILKMLIEVTAL